MQGTESEESVAPPTLGRLAVADRYATSAAISRWTYPSAEADTVYLARGDVFIDALAAGTLTDGPVLLVPGCDGVPNSVAEEIATIDPTGVVALGGEGAVCDETLEEAGAGRQTDRLAGDSRFDTAAAIAAHEFGDSADTVYLAQGSDTSPDAIAAGMLTDGPILLVSPDGTRLPTGGTGIASAGRTATPPRCRSPRLPSRTATNGSTWPAAMGTTWPTRWSPES